jgi:hypothetical protein
MAFELNIRDKAFGDRRQGNPLAGELRSAWTAALERLRKPS